MFIGYKQAFDIMIKMVHDSNTEIMPKINQLRKMTMKGLQTRVKIITTWSELFDIRIRS